MCCCAIEFVISVGSICVFCVCSTFLWGPVSSLSGFPDLLTAILDIVGEVGQWCSRRLQSAMSPVQNWADPCRSSCGVFALCACTLHCLESIGCQCDSCLFGPLFATANSCLFNNHDLLFCILVMFLAPALSCRRNMYTNCLRLHKVHPPGCTSFAVHFNLSLKAYICLCPVLMVPRP
jgi:hypothetical protein